MADLRDQLQAALGTAYAVERELGGGGMSRVFLATDTRLRRQVVVKVLAPELAAGISAERFEREIQLAAALQHPNIVPVLSAGEVSGIPYYTMPFVEGASLRQRLHDVPTTARAEMLDILRDTVKALAYAHRHGVVHRDIKPDNILVNDGAAVVTDFGIAKAVSAAKTNAPGGTLTSIGASLGTPAYMAPEQAAGDTVDHRADIYSWGVVAYETLAGRHPFADRTSAQQLIAAHISEKPKALRDAAPTVSAALSSLVMRCLEKDTSRRPQSAPELLADLESARTGGSGAVVSPGSRRNRAMIAAAVAAALAVAAVVTWRGQRDVRTDAQVIAVMPFRVAGAEPALHYLREGMLDLITAKLSVGQGVRAVDSRTLMAAWKRAGGSESDDPEDAAALRMAAGVGAGDLLSGEVVGNSARLTISARIASTSGGKVSARGTVEGPADSLTTLVDRLCAQLLSLRAGESEQSLASLTSTSPQALRHYLEGRRLLRAAKIAPAGEKFSLALDADSNFVPAALGLASVGGWSGALRFARRGEDALFRLRDRMTPFDRISAAFWVSDNYPRAPQVGTQIAAAERVMARSPDSPEAISNYADVLYHYAPFVGIPNSAQRARDLWLRTLALDSTYVLHLSHMPKLMVELRDAAALERLAALADADTTVATFGPVMRLLAAAIRGDTAAKNRMIAGMDKWSPPSLLQIRANEFSAVCPECRLAATAVLEPLVTTEGQRNGQQLNIAEFHVLAGRPGAAAAAMKSHPGSDRFAVAWHAFADGDSAAAVAGAAGIASAIAAAPQNLNRRRVSEFLLLGIHAAGRDDSAALRHALGQLRALPVPADSVDLALERDHAALVLSAQSAVATRRPDARAQLSRLDSIQQTSPSGLPFIVAAFVLGRGWERLGEPRKALASLRSVPRDWSGTQVYAATRMRDIGRIAASLGDRDEALEAFGVYLAYRRDPEPRLRADLESVKREVARLEALGR